MITCHAGGDAATNLLERRWFAANNAATAVRAECEVLREVVELAETSWRRARAQLARLEVLRDCLGEVLAELDGEQEAGMAIEETDREAVSAA
jgi:hypothetical protein